MYYSMRVWIWKSISLLLFVGWSAVQAASSPQRSKKVGLALVGLVQVPDAPQPVEVSLVHLGSVGQLLVPTVHEQLREIQQVYCGRICCTLEPKLETVGGDYSQPLTYTQHLFYITAGLTTRLIRRGITGVYEHQRTSSMYRGSTKRGSSFYIHPETVAQMPLFQADIKVEDLTLKIITPDDYSER